METGSTPLKAAHRFSTGKRLIIGFGTVISIVALFGLLGYYWLPGYAKAKLEALEAEFTGINRSPLQQIVIRNEEGGDPVAST